MDADTSHLLGALVRSRSVAALATLHDGRPFASMIPYAVWHDDGRLRFVTHVSRLSAHTRDMLESPEACLLITAPEPDGTDAVIPPQALPRVSIPVTAEFVGAEHPDHAPLKAAYLGRFPFAAEWFALGDFSIVSFEPAAARFVAGFARAMTVSPAQLLAACRG